MNKIITPVENIYIPKIINVGYVRNSEGRSDNIRLWVKCNLNTQNNNTSIEYEVECFKDMIDYQQFISTDYQEAVNKYNELLNKYDGYKIKVN